MSLCLLWRFYNNKFKILYRISKKSKFIFFRYNKYSWINFKNFNKWCDKRNFVNSIQNFRARGASYIEYFKGNEEIEPIFAFFGLCNYINDEFRNTNNFWSSDIFSNFTEIENFPRNRFPHIYETIKQFEENYKSPFGNCFYYILLNLTKCPNCNSTLEANIPENYGISSFLPLPGYDIDKVSNLINNYISNQDSSKNIYQCNSCYYNGPGKKEKGFINTPKFLLIDFNTPQDLKFLDETLDFTSYSFGKIGPKKYKIFAFIIKDKNDKYKPYILNDKNFWYTFTEDNVIEEEVLISLNHETPHIAIYKGD